MSRARTGENVESSSTGNAIAALEEKLEHLEAEVALLRAEIVAARIDRGEEMTFPGAVARAIFVEGQPPIRVFRRWRGLSQAQLATRTGSSKAYISQLETGRRRAGVGMLRKLAAVLEVPMDLLMEQTAPAADAAATGRGRRTGR